MVYGKPYDTLLVCTITQMKMTCYYGLFITHASQLWKKKRLCDCDKTAVRKTGLGKQERKCEQKERPGSVQQIHQFNHFKMSCRGKIIIIQEHNAPEVTLQVV